MTAKNRFRNRVAFVTGCGSKKGIGFAAARIIATGGAITSTTDRIYGRAKELEDDSWRYMAWQP